jgi:isopropylmalate/homocitrate/citramalate synthase
MSDIDIKDYNDSVSKATDEVLAFMFGVEDALERTILRYIFKSGNSSKAASYHQILHYIVDTNGYCTEGRLRKRLDSLTKFGYIIKEEYLGIIIYRSNIADLKDHAEGSF